MKNYTQNQGRETLFNLDEDLLYIVEGEYVEQHQTSKDHVVRLTLQNVLVREYDTNKHTEDCSVVAFADHLHTIRKRDGLENLKLTPGKRYTFVGKTNDYTTAKNPGVLRRTMKLFRDVRIDRELSKVRARLRNNITLLDALSPEVLSQQLNKTEKLALRVRDFVREDKLFVPHLTKEEIKESLDTISTAITALRSYT
jgi:hypothetical protein